MKQVFKSMTLAIAAAISLSSAALAASDAPADIRISHSDLDLTRPDDAATFKTRVAAAVNTWCAENENLFAGQGGRSARSSCRTHANRLVSLSTPAAHKQALRVAAAASREPAIEVAAR